jgi:N-acetylneuraminate synthase
MTPDSWRDMVRRTRELEKALGSPDKRVGDNERDTVVVQRRCLRAAREIRTGDILNRAMIDVLRPATPGAILPYEIESVVGTRALVDIPAGEALRWTMLVS